MRSWRRTRFQKPSDTSRNFLKTLVDPPGATIDIVAVHGLNPLDKPSHAEATWTAGNKLWLRDFLPKRVPSARVLLFGYNSNVAFQTAAAGVREQAENLLNQLEAARVMDPDRPLMFICHSLGGIIVKRALVHSKTDTTYERIGKSTFGIAFFGTPHKGGNNAGLADVIAKIARSLLGNPSNSFMSAIRAGTLFLDTIADDFRQLLEDFQILTFYETKPLGSFGIVVSPSSAILGLSGTREKRIAMDTDHRNLCKFECENDPRYEQVAVNIVKMVNDATSPRETPAPIEAEDKGNVSRCIGDQNTIFQSGDGNQSDIYGHINMTHQMGNRNYSEQDGDNNKTMQITMGALAVEGYAELLKFFSS
ncbi:hypothetical protein F5Y00DRAFT_244189 [Daldinia vernicosa]|uniref:uncharacterized protein n=1 Tax=Daldinia vernicosa TaxID=114800 RepID=UPI002007929F|nr:uncharacterized protein F5Y00DRAFT_244189 [Daldinia vernicosa]KAI0846312.1 hypothetical protein F5Y00DRAFT_244189 [Daldinia vernicosa]